MAGMFMLGTKVFPTGIAAKLLSTKHIHTESPNALLQIGR
jgi:hypothetical protein